MITRPSTTGSTPTSPARMASQRRRAIAPRLVSGGAARSAAAASTLALDIGRPDVGSHRRHVGRRVDVLDACDLGGYAGGDRAHDLLLGRRAAVEDRHVAAQ